MNSNSFLTSLKQSLSETYTENGALVYNSTLNPVLDLFALGGAYRCREPQEIRSLFLKAWYKDQELALKCLFYLRDVRGGQGERRFFREAIKALPNSVKEAIIPIIPEFGRYDDILALLDGCYNNSKIFEAVCLFIKKTLEMDEITNYPSLLAKWLPSENASSQETKDLAKRIRKGLGFSAKKYRLTLSHLREKLKVVERLMSAGDWEEIEYEHVPSKAALKYHDAFEFHDEERYLEFLSKGKVNAKTLYPYDIVDKALKEKGEDPSLDIFWENLINFFDGTQLDALPVIDTSGSMLSGTPFAMSIAISLGLYFAEKCAPTSPFYNHFMLFSHNPHLVEIQGRNLKEKAKNIASINDCSNTDLLKVFKVILNTCLSHKVEPPKQVLILSDMEFDAGRSSSSRLLEEIKETFTENGLVMPRCIWWNVQSRNNIIPQQTKSAVYVSGASPSVIKAVLSGKSQVEVMLDILNSKRYSVISSLLPKQTLY